jgi:cytidine deaminase
MNSDAELALYQAAVVVAKEQAQRQADDDAEGVGVGAAALTDDGEILTGVWIDAMVDSACLCAETGPISEAHRRGRKLTASICVRWSQSNGSTVLAACGVCQERLAIFGSDLLIGVADTAERGFRFEPLAALRPSPWWESRGDDSSSA